jgi:hypothetical protein
MAEAQSEVASVRDATSDWRNEAAALNLPRREIDLMAQAFETDQRRVANSLDR